MGYALEDGDQTDMRGRGRGRGQTEKIQKTQKLI